MLEKIVTVFYANWMIFDEDIGLKVQITENSDTEKCKYADVSKKNSRYGALTYCYFQRTI